MTIDHDARETPPTQREAMIEEFHAARSKRGRSPKRPSLLPPSDSSPKAVAVSVIRRDLARPDSDKG